MALASGGTLSPTQRLLPLDGLRGFIMIVMALDHTNALVAHGKLTPELWVGLFPDYQGDGLAFLTRLMTHVAAPGFFLLMGAGMALFSLSHAEPLPLTPCPQARRRKRWRIVWHFILRGGLLILLQLTLENRVWGLGESIGATYFGVLYGLGGVMMIGSLLLFLPTPVLVSISLTLLVGTEALLPKSGGSFTEYAPLLRLLLLPGYTPGLYVLYPLLPWLGVAGLGIVYGRWLRHDAAQAYRGAIGLGMLAIIRFIVLRALNGFGNIRPVIGNDWIAFLNLVKYPPSLTFLLLTLGVDLLLLGLMAGLSGRAWRLLSGLAVYGRVPLFFYLVHLYLYALIGSLISPQGMPIARMYPYWLLGLMILFPLCWAYGRFKQARPAESLWRLL